MLLSVITIIESFNPQDAVSCTQMAEFSCQLSYVSEYVLTYLTEIKSGAVCSILKCPAIEMWVYNQLTNGVRRIEPRRSRLL